MLDLVHKKIHSVDFFMNKKKAYHAAAGELHRYWKQTARLYAHRVRRVNERLTYHLLLRRASSNSHQST
jgi:hypothetical protein